MAENLIELNEEELLGQSIFLPDDITKDKNFETKDIEEIKALMEHKRICKVMVMGVGPDNSLKAAIGDEYIGIIPAEEVYRRKLDRRILQKFVGREVGVAVKSVDEEKKIVILSINKAKETLREIYFKKLKPGDVVSAVVTFVNKVNNRIHIDVDSCGYFGYVPIKEWGYKYIYDPDKQIKKGSIIKVQVIKVLPERVVGENIFKHHFIASRKALLEVPWVGIEEKLPYGTELIAKCEQLTNKHNFFASSPLLKELEIFVEYPDNAKVVPISNNTEDEDELEFQSKDKIIIREGEYYLVYIYKVSEKDRLLKGRVKARVKNPNDTKVDSGIWATDKIIAKSKK